MIHGKTTESILNYLMYYMYHHNHKHKMVIENQNQNITSIWVNTVMRWRHRLKYDIVTNTERGMLRWLEHIYSSHLISYKKMSEKSVKPFRRSSTTNTTYTRFLYTYKMLIELLIRVALHVCTLIKFITSLKR